MKEDIEEIIKRSIGKDINLKLELKKKKEEIDVEKILGDEFEKQGNNLEKGNVEKVKELW
jgi:DNA polymerase-3 subunit gamma/tau